MEEVEKKAKTSMDLFDNWSFKRLYGRFFDLLSSSSIKGLILQENAILKWTDTIYIQDALRWRELAEGRVRTNHLVVILNDRKANFDPQGRTARLDAKVIKRLELLVEDSKVLHLQ